MDLMPYLPFPVYHDEEYTADFQDAVGVEVEQFVAARDDLFLQLRPSTSTWGMRNYEKDYGIVPDARKTKEQRLSHWRAKRRGRGTTTLEVMKSVVESFLFTNVVITELPSLFRFLIKAVIPFGDEADLVSMQSVISDIKPAHLDYGLLIEKSMPDMGVYILAYPSYGHKITINPYTQEHLEEENTISMAAVPSYGHMITVGER